MAIATPTYVTEIAHTALNNVTTKATGAFTPSANALLFVDRGITAASSGRRRHYLPIGFLRRFA